MLVLGRHRRQLRPLLSSIPADPAQAGVRAGLHAVRGRRVAHFLGTDRPGLRPVPASSSAGCRPSASPTAPASRRRASATRSSTGSRSNTPRAHGGAGHRVARARRRLLLRCCWRYPSGSSRPCDLVRSLDRGADGLRPDRDLGAPGLDRADLRLLLRLQARHITPITGYADFIQSTHAQPGGPVQWAYHLILPWMTFAILFAALYARMIRANVDGDDERGLRADRARQGARPSAQRASARTSSGTRCCRS